MPIDKEIRELDKFWDDLIFQVSGGNPASMREVSSFEIHDFFRYVDNWIKNNGRSKT